MLCMIMFTANLFYNHLLTFVYFSVGYPNLLPLKKTLTVTVMVTVDVMLTKVI